MVFFSQMVTYVVYLVFGKRHVLIRSKYGRIEQVKFSTNFKFEKEHFSGNSIQLGKKCVCKMMATTAIGNIYVLCDKLSIIKLFDGAHGDIYIYIYMSVYRIVFGLACPSYFPGLLSDFSTSRSNNCLR